MLPSSTMLSHDHRPPDRRRFRTGKATVMNDRLYTAARGRARAGLADRRQRGVSDPSSTRMLAVRVAGKALEALRRGVRDATGSVIELAPIAVDIARAILSAHLDGRSRRHRQRRTDQWAAAQRSGAQRDRARPGRPRRVPRSHSHGRDAPRRGPRAPGQGRPLVHRPRRARPHRPLGARPDLRRRRRGRPKAGGSERAGKGRTTPGHRQQHGLGLRSARRDWLRGFLSRRSAPRDSRPTSHRHSPAPGTTCARRWSPATRPRASCWA